MSYSLYHRRARSMSRYGLGQEDQATIDYLAQQEAGLTAGDGVTLTLPPVEQVVVPALTPAQVSQTASAVLSESALNQLNADLLAQRNAGQKQTPGQVSQQTIVNAAGKPIATYVAAGSSLPGASWFSGTTAGISNTVLAVGGMGAIAVALLSKKKGRR